MRSARLGRTVLAMVALLGVAAAEAPGEPTDPSPVEAVPETEQAPPDDVISVPFDKIVRGSPGASVEVADVEVDPAMVGRTCTMSIIAENQASVHEGNDLIINTGGQELVVEGVEDRANEAVTTTYEVELGPRIEIAIRLGRTRLSSLGFELSFDCAELDTTPTTAGPPPSVDPSVVTVPPTNPPTTAAPPTAPPTPPAPTTAPTAAPTVPPTTAAPAPTAPPSTAAPSPTVAPTTVAAPPVPAVAPGSPLYPGPAPILPPGVGRTPVRSDAPAPPSVLGIVLTRPSTLGATDSPLALWPTQFAQWLARLSPAAVAVTATPTYTG